MMAIASTNHPEPPGATTPRLGSLPELEALNLSEAMAVNKCVGKWSPVLVAQKRWVEFLLGFCAKLHSTQKVAS